MSWRKDKIDQSIDALLSTNKSLMSALQGQHDFTMNLSRDLTWAHKRISELEKRMNINEG